jgi:hypothetical protein
MRPGGGAGPAFCRMRARQDLPRPLAPRPEPGHIPPSARSRRTTTMTSPDAPTSHVFSRKLTRTSPRIVRGDGCWLYAADGRA